MLFSLSSVQQYMLTSVCIQHTCAELYVLAFGLHSLWDAFEISDMFDKWWTIGFIALQFLDLLMLFGRCL
jgi:hypothetical protein